MRLSCRSHCNGLDRRSFGSSRKPTLVWPNLLPVPETVKLTCTRVDVHGG